MTESHKCQYCGTEIEDCEFHDRELCVEVMYETIKMKNRYITALQNQIDTDRRKSVTVGNLPGCVIRIREKDNHDCFKDYSSDTHELVLFQAAYAALVEKP